jgi:hypothetical protein
MGVLRRSADHQRLGQRKRGVRHERLSPTPDRDHPFLRVGVRVGIGDLVGGEPLQREVEPVALGDGDPPEPRGTRSDELVRRGPEHAEIVEDFGQVSGLVLDPHGSYESSGATSAATGQGPKVRKVAQPADIKSDRPRSPGRIDVTSED